MAGRLPWFKAFVADVLDDPRARGLTDSQQLCYVVLEAVARANGEPELGVLRMSVADIAWRAHRTEEWIKDGIHACAGAGLLEIQNDGSLFLPDFAERQAQERKPEDPAKVAARAKRYRLNKREAVTAPVTQRDDSASRNGEEKRRDGTADEAGESVVPLRPAARRGRGHRG